MRGIILTLVGGLFLAACTIQIPPPSPDNPNTSLDGDWTGERIVERGTTSCRHSSMSARITDGVAHLFLNGGAMILSAIVAEDGRVRFYRNVDERSDHYIGEPNADGSEIRGVWAMNDTQCTGSWVMTRSS